MSEKSLSNKRALVTGGTRGIGFAIAKQFCEEGASVVIAGRDEERGQAAAEQLQAEGHDAHFEQVDMTELEQVQRMVGNAAIRLGGLDILVNNAGGTGRSTLAKLDEDTWDRAIATNARGPVFAMQAAAEIMKTNDNGGSIVNISSIAGQDNPFGLGAYAASKAALESSTVVASKEWAKSKIRVNAIAPGMIETDMTSNIKPDIKEALVNNIPLGKAMGNPEDIAGPVTMLASDAGKYITGQVIRVDGGLRL